MDSESYQNDNARQVIMMWINLPLEDKLAILGAAERQVHISNRAIEKDWWVTMVLQALFNSPFAQHLVFKGGTSLSKAWHLIERFSEKSKRLDFSENTNINKIQTYA